MTGGPGRSTSSDYLELAIEPDSRACLSSSPYAVVHQMRRNISLRRRCVIGPPGLEKPGNEDVQQLPGASPIWLSSRGGSVVKHFSRTAHTLSILRLDCRNSQLHKASPRTEHLFLHLLGALVPWSPGAVHPPLHRHHSSPPQPEVRHPSAKRPNFVRATSPRPLYSPRFARFGESNCPPI